MGNVIPSKGLEYVTYVKYTIEIKNMWFNVHDVCENCVSAVLIHSQRESR